MAHKLKNKWSRKDDLLYCTVKGEEHFPSANDVFDCVFEMKEIYPGLRSGSPENLPALTFSRYPAQLFIDIKCNQVGQASVLQCHVFANGEGVETRVADINTRKVDHIIIEDSWFPFTSGAKEEVLEILAGYGIHQTGEISFKQFMQLKKAALNNDVIRDRNAGEIIHPGFSMSSGDDALSLFDGTLYPYQEDGWKWLGFIARQGLGGILADEMGLGKTIQVIAVLAMPEREKVAPSLIVTPSTLLENWRREIAKFAPSLKTCVHQGGNRTGLPVALKENDVVITSYDTVIRDGALFGMIDWKLVVLDEAQAIKNPETRRAAAIKKLNREVSIAVTGTPIENRLRDLWSVMDFAVPDYLGSEDEFNKNFEDSADGAGELEPFVSPVMLRRRVADVAKDLPERIIVPQALVFSDAEISAYEQERQRILEEYGASASLVSLIRLRMFCAHPWLLEEEMPNTGDPVSFGKFQRLVQIIEEIFANGEKVLVFTSWTRMSDLIVSTVEKHFGIYAEYIDGRTPVPDRQNVVDAFSAVKGPALLALNPRAAGTGLNITAANHVIHYNLEWNPAVEDQASARAYRRGQERPVTIHRLFVVDTVEEAINQRLERKRLLADAAVIGVEGKDDDYGDIMQALQMSPMGGLT